MSELAVLYKALVSALRSTRNAETPEDKVMVAKELRRASEALCKALEGR